MNLDFEQIAENNLGEMIIICVFAIKYLRRKRQRRWICSLESMQNLRKTTKRVFYTLLYIAQATKILLRFAHQVATSMCLPNRCSTCWVSTMSITYRTRS